jgi:hypothetical protein
MFVPHLYQEAGVTFVTIALASLRYMLRTGEDWRLIK